MDSSVPPPPPSFHQRKLRPWYLVATLGLVWLVGLNALISSYRTVDYLREGTLADMQVAQREAEQQPSVLKAIDVILEHARLRAMSAEAQVTFPLQVAKLLLAGLLVVASGLAIRGRRGARALALQALAANALLAVADYVLTRNVRSAWIEAASRELLPQLSARPGPPAGDMAVLIQLTDRVSLWWIERVRFFVFDLGAPLLAAFALTRTQTKIFFDAVARAAEQAEEP